MQIEGPATYKLFLKSLYGFNTPTVHFSTSQRHCHHTYISKQLALYDFFRQLERIVMNKVRVSRVAIILLTSVSSVGAAKVQLFEEGLSECFRRNRLQDEQRYGQNEMKSDGFFHHFFSLIPDQIWASSLYLD